MSEPYRWIGNIRRDGDGIVGHIQDNGPGFIIHLRGERCEGGYRIVGTPGLMPPPYLIPMLDDA